MPCRENEYEPVPDVSPGLSMVWVKVNVRFVAPLGTVTGIVEDTREDPDSTVRVNVYTTMPSTSTCPVDAPIDGPQLIKLSNENVSTLSLIHISEPTRPY